MRSLIILFISCIFIVSGCAQNPLGLNTASYKKLIIAIAASPKKTLNTEYTPASNRGSKVELTLYLEKDGTLVVVYKLPKEGIYSLDKRTGKKIPSKEALVITMRDHNLDGNPDDYFVSPGIPPDDIEYTTDGYVKFNPRRDSFIIDPWQSAIRIAARHFSE